MRLISGFEADCIQFNFAYIGHYMYKETQCLIFSATGPKHPVTLHRACVSWQKQMSYSQKTAQTPSNPLLATNALSFRLYQEFINFQIDGSQHVPLPTSHFNNEHTLTHVSTIMLS